MSTISRTSRSRETVDRVSRLRLAAARLADAAAKMAAAAEAMSIAVTSMKIQQDLSHSFLETSDSRRPAPDENAGEDTISDEECTNPEDSNYYVSDDEGLDYAKLKRQEEERERQLALAHPCMAGPMTIDQLKFDRSISSPTIDPENEAQKSFHILVDREGDVWPVVCSIISRYDRVVCYVCCGLPAMAMYKSLIQSVTGAIVFTITETSIEELDSVGTKFLQSENSVLLLPETVCVEILLNTELTSCVLHVNWPVDAVQYKNQTAAHQAGANILVAFKEDTGIFPAGLEIFTDTISWPNTEHILKEAEMSNFRFEVELAKIPAVLKEKTYPDWIASHGPRGPRYASSWDSTTLVHRANLYLLDVLQYQGEDLDTRLIDGDSELQVSLPRVSPGFVTYNGLEQAVEDGVLHIVSENGENPFANANKDMLPLGTLSLNDSASLPNFGHGDPPNTRDKESSSGLGSKQSDVDVPSSLTGSVKYPGDAQRVQSTSPSFEVVHKHTYIPISDDFDAIPLICFLGKVHDKVVCLLDDAAALIHYAALFRRILTFKLFCPAKLLDESAIEEAAGEFASYPSSAMLLLYFNDKTFPNVLKTASPNCAIYWGYHLPFKQAAKHRSLMPCPSTYIIMTTTQRDERLTQGTMDVESHPSSSLFLSQDPNSLLAPMRQKTEDALKAIPRTVKSLYRARIYWFGKLPRRVMSAEDVARSANIYSAKILLRGEVEGVESTRKPIGQRLSVGEKLIKSFSLEPAVEKGLIC